MNTYKKLILVSIFFLLGCETSKNTESVSLMTTDSLTSLVKEAIAGNFSSNYFLSGLIDFTTLGNESYYSIKVDRFSSDTVIFYYVLLEHLNPINNRLAFYDKDAKCYLIDKSLIGKLSIDTFTVDKMQLIKVIENFLSKGNLQLKRLSLYKYVNGTIRLVYRSFAELQTLAETFTQTITLITQNTIETTLILPERIGKEFYKDYFSYNSTENRFVSSNSPFDSLILYEINNYSLDK